jgi:ElaB/YqjD/DUF883 family membrane-anchored ribosome-binding protein
VAAEQNTRKPDVGSQPGSRPSTGADRMPETAPNAVTGIAGKAQDWASGAVDTAKGMASNAADTAKNWGAGVAHGAERAYSATRDSVVGVEESLESVIRRHPLQAVLIAMGIGCMAGYAISRR